MKRLFALLLILTLLCACTVPALATKHYSTALMSSLQYDANTLASQKLQIMSAAIILLDYAMATGNSDILDQLDFNDGVCRIASYNGTHVDVYFQCLDGTYVNLFYSPTLGTGTDYGNTLFNENANSNTYGKVSMRDVYDRLAMVIEALSN